MYRWLPTKASERSRVGQKLSDLTTQKIIVGILAILLVIPVFNIYSGLYGTYTGLTQGGLNMLHRQYLDVPLSPLPLLLYHRPNFRLSIRQLSSMLARNEIILLWTVAFHYILGISNTCMPFILLGKHWARSRCLIFAAMHHLLGMHWLCLLTWQPGNPIQACVVHCFLNILFTASSHSLLLHSNQPSFSVWLEWSTLKLSRHQSEGFCV